MNQKTNEAGNSGNNNTAGDGRVGFGNLPPVCRTA